MRRCTMAETLTEKQRVAVETLEGARRAGVPLSDYAKAKGLATRPVYDAIAALRRRGALPGTDRPRKHKSKFLPGGGGEIAVLIERALALEAHRGGLDDRDAVGGGGHPCSINLRLVNRSGATHSD